MGRLQHLLDPNSTTAVAETTRPTAGRLGRQLAATRTALAEDPERRAKETLAFASALRAPIGQIEAFLPQLKSEYDWYKFKRKVAGAGEAAAFDPIDPSDPFSVRDVPEDFQIGMIEQVQRMDALEWSKRLPFSPMGMVHTGELAQAVQRLATDQYEGAVAREAKSLGRLTAGLEREGNEPKVDTEVLKETLRGRDRMLIEQWLLRRQEEADRGMTFGASVFNGASYMPAWMIEFAVTGGLAKLGSRTAQDIAVRTLRGYAKTTAGRAILKTAGWTGGAITRTTLGMPHRIGEDILERRIGSISAGPGGELTIELPTESWATSIAKGWGHAVIETASETTGEGITKGVVWTAKKSLPRLPFGSKLYDAMRTTYLTLHPEDGAAAEFTARFFNAAKFDGLLGEMGEERINTILHAIAGTERYSTDPNAGPLDNLVAGITRDLEIKNLAVEATVLAIPTGGRIAAGQIGRIGIHRPPGGQKGVLEDVQRHEAQGQVGASQKKSDAHDARESASIGAEITTQLNAPARAEVASSTASDQGQFTATTPTKQEEQAKSGAEFHILRDFDFKQAKTRRAARMKARTAGRTAPPYESFTPQEIADARSRGHIGIAQLLASRFPGTEIDVATTTESVYVRLPGGAAEIRLSSHAKYGSNQPRHIQPNNLSLTSLPTTLDRAIRAAYSNASSYSQVPDWPELLDAMKEQGGAPVVEMPGEAGIVVYRGGGETLDVGRGGNRGISVTTDQKHASDFTDEAGGIVSTAILPNTAKILSEPEIPSELNNAYLSAAKEFTKRASTASEKGFEWHQRNVHAKQQAIVDWAREHGYDAVKFPFENEIRVIRPNVLRPLSAAAPVVETPAGEAGVIERGHGVFWHASRGPLDLKRKFNVSDYPDGLDLMDYLGLHVGTKKAARTRTKSDFFEGEKPKITPLEIDIKKPFGNRIWTEDELRPVIQEYGQRNGITSGKNTAIRAKEEMQKEGSDGILYYNSEEDPGSVSAIVFSPSAAKIGQPAEQAGIEKQKSQIANEQGVSDELIAAAEAEAAAQARERFQGPDQFTYEDFTEPLAQRTPEELRRMARSMGVRPAGGGAENLAKWVADGVTALTQEGPEPEAVLEGEPHPGSMTYPRFFERYGEALAHPETPENRAWMDRYGRESERGVRGLYRALQAEWRRVNAWTAFYELTGQQRPPAEEIAQPAASQGPPQAAGEADDGFTDSESEAREGIVEEEAREVRDALDQFFGRVPPDDLPPAGAEGAPELTPQEGRFFDALWRIYRNILHDLNIRDAPGYPTIHKKDFIRALELVQTPQDIATTHPEGRPFMEITRRRTNNRRRVTRLLAETMEPYFSMSDRSLVAVDQALVAKDQHPGEPELTSPLFQSLSEEAKAAYTAARKALKTCGDMVIEVMRQLGLPEERISEFASRIEDYIPHNWYGDWAVLVWRSDQLGPNGIRRAGEHPEIMTAVHRWQTRKEKDRLARYYPGHKIEILERTKLPDEFYQDAPAYAVGRMIDEIIARCEATLSPQAAEVMKAMSSDIRKERAFGVHFKHRNETPGWSENLRRPLAEYMAGFAGWITKLQAALEFADAVEKLDPSKPNLYRYWTDYVKYQMANTQEFSWVNQAAYVYYLQARPWAAATNLSGNLVMGWPVLSKYTNRSLLRLMTAASDLAEDAGISPETRATALAQTIGGNVTEQAIESASRPRVTEEEYRFLDELDSKTDCLESRQAEEISSRGGNALLYAIRNPISKGLSYADLFQHAERFNRRSMALALYRAGFRDFDRVAEIVNEAHFEYGKGNRPVLARGYTRPVMVFRLFQINQMIWIKNEIKAGRIPPVARSMLATILLGGLKALPFAGLALYLYTKIFKRDPQEDAAQLVGDQMAEVLLHGAPTMAGIDMSRSVAMDLVPTPEPGQPLTSLALEYALGVPADMVAKLARGRADLANGNVRRFIEDFSPSFAAGSLAARRMARGVETRKGRIIWDYDRQEQLRLDPYEQILKAMGAPLARINRQYEKDTVLKILSEDVTHLKARWADRLYVAIKHDDDEAKREIISEIEEYNAWRKRQDRKDLMVWTNERTGELNVGEVISAIKLRAKPVNQMTDQEKLIYRKIYGEQP